MPSTDNTALQVTTRQPGGSREARRLRRSGDVPGVLYGAGEDPVAFQVSARTLRHVLADAGAVLELQIDGAGAGPVMLKDLARHPVNGDTLHIDLLRVRLDEKIQTTVVLELTGAEDAAGVKEGGVLEHITRELSIEALPNDIPDTVTHDVSAMAVGDTLTLESITAPAKVTLLDDPETVIATLTPPRLQVESTDEIEQETGVVGEGEGEAQDDAPAADEAGDASADDAA